MTSKGPCRQIYTTPQREDLLDDARRLWPWLSDSALFWGALKLCVQQSQTDPRFPKLPEYVPKRETADA